MGEPDRKFPASPDEAERDLEIGISTAEFWNLHDTLLKSFRDTDHELDHRLSDSPSQHSDAPPDRAPIADHHPTARPDPIDAPGSVESSSSSHDLPKRVAGADFAAPAEDIRLMGPRHAVQLAQSEARAANGH